MKTWPLLIVAALLGGCAGFILSSLDVFGSLILFLSTYHLLADGEAERRHRYGTFIIPYWIFIIALYGVVLIKVQSNMDSVVSAASLLLMTSGAILGLIVYGLKKLFRAYVSRSLKQPQSLEG